jgi:hypothetical protein
MMTMTAHNHVFPETGGRLYCRLIQDDWPELPKLCLLKGECYHCAFEQWLQAVSAEDDGTAGKPGTLH